MKENKRFIFVKQSKNTFAEYCTYGRCILVWPIAWLRRNERRTFVARIKVTVQQLGLVAVAWLDRNQARLHHCSLNKHRERNKRGAQQQLRVQLIRVIVLRNSSRIFNFPCKASCGRTHHADVAFKANCTLICTLCIWTSSTHQTVLGLLNSKGARSTRETRSQIVLNRYKYKESRYIYYSLLENFC